MEKDAYHRVNSAIRNTFDGIDKDITRKLQGEMFRCSAKCTDDRTSSMETVQNCLNRCSSPLSMADKYIQEEVANFQNRLNRCALDCQDAAKDKIKVPGVKESDIPALEKEMNMCLAACANKHIQLIPALDKRIREAVQKENYSH